MEKKQNNNYLIFLNILIVVYSLYISLSVFKEKAVVTDDLAGVYALRVIPDSYFSYIYSFLDSTIMAARPVSGIITGTLSFLSKNNESAYLLGTLFFPLSLIAVYWVGRKMLSKELANLITLLYCCSIIGTSIQFTSIMLNSNLATIFFVLSIYYVYVRKKIIVSALLFIASVLSYEIFLPLVLLPLFLIRENKKRVLFALLTLGVIITFRKVIQPYIFVNSYQRDEVGRIFELKRVMLVVIFSVKLFVKDLFVGIYKGLLNIRNLNIPEWVLSVVIPFVVYKAFRNYDFKSKSEYFKKLGMISFVAILVGLSIFLFSSYIPTLFGFNNRNLGAIRLFYTLLIISGVIYLSVKLNVQSRMISVFFAVIAFLLVVTNIRVKDSWIYASHFNNELFSKLNKAIRDNHIEGGDICLEYDVFHELKTNPNLTFREPLFYDDWESSMLCEINGIDPKKFKVHNMDNKNDCEVKFQYKNGKMFRIK